MKNTAKFLISSMIIASFTCAQMAFADELKPVTVNDTFSNQQWYLKTIDAFRAWETRGAYEPIVAVIDTGVDDTHPELAGALWTDPGEPLDGKDNDGDGLVDDAHGWNFVDETNATRPVKASQYDEAGWIHGTAVSGIIAGRGNNDVGMAGMAWNAKIMPLVILGEHGQGDTEDLTRAIRYATEHGADIINLSLEGDLYDEAVENEILDATARGVLMVIASGNSNVDTGNNEIFPACSVGAAGQGVLVVTAVGEDNRRLPGSNYGKCVSLAAPGENMLTIRNSQAWDGTEAAVSGYDVYSGTSLAAPLVSGTAAMLKSLHPDWSGEQIAQRIKDTVKRQEDESLGAGLLDAGAAIMESIDVRQYGLWKLQAAKPGYSPEVYITDNQNKELFTLQAGESGDRRGIRAVFVRWDADRYPEVLVTAIGDETGSWRVYRRDGVLLAAGQASNDPADKIAGGLYLAGQDMNADGRDEVMMTEVLGTRGWLINAEEKSVEPFQAVDGVAYGSLAVGLQRPVQGLVLVSRAQQSYLSILAGGDLQRGTDLNTGNPKNIVVWQGRTLANKEMVRLIQSGPPLDLMEKDGSLQAVDEQKNIRWRQAPAGINVEGEEGRLFYDVWPR